jgi:hypothetical protein
VWYLQGIEIYKSTIDAPVVGMDEYQKSHSVATGGVSYPASIPATAATNAPRSLGATGTIPPTTATTETLDPQQEALRLEEEAKQKEEDDFLKLESIFISELGIDPNFLPM